MIQVKSYLKSKFVTDRTVGFFIGMGCALLSIVLSIIFYALVFKDRIVTAHEGLSTTMTFLLMLFGGLSYLLVIFIDYKHVKPFAPIVPVLLCSIGFAIHVNLTSYPLADKMTGVAFFGGDPGIFLAFAILFGICTIGLIVCSFMRLRKATK